MLRKYQHISGPSGILNTEQIELTLRNSTPINCKSRVYRSVQQIEIEEQVADMLKAGVIRKYSGVYCSPGCLVPKGDNTWRFCVDYRCVDRLIVVEHFHYHRLTNWLDLSGGLDFSSHTLDLSAGLVSGRYPYIRIHRFYHTKWCLRVECITLWINKRCRSISKKNAQHFQ